MRDITPALFKYREAKSHLWNTYFIDNVRSLVECGILDRYEEIDRLLFSALVLDPLGKSHFEADFGSAPIPFLKVAPLDGADQITMMISEPIVDLNRVWNKPATLTSLRDSEFTFIELFEWNRYGHVIYPYFKARIDKYPMRPDLVARDALVETWKARVLFKEEE
ncbi:MAG: hypothetical protein AB1452_14445 [Pseudomonadota bacterium]